MRKKIHQLILVCGAILGLMFLSALFPRAAQAYETVGDKPADIECHWVTSGQIICTYDAPGVVDVFVEREKETDCSEWHKYSCIDFWFNAKKSKEMNYPVFERQDKTSYVYFAGGDPTRGMYIWSRPPAENSYRLFGYTDGNIDVKRIRQANEPANGNACSLLKTANCDEPGGGDIKDSTISAPGYNSKNFMAAVAEAIKKEDIMDTCNNSVKLGFIFCPILEAVNKGIASMIGGGEVVDGERKGILISFLQLPPLLGKNSPIGAVVGNVVTVANVLFVFIFLAIIFSSSLPLGLSNYSIKKMLPKFIAAVIMTQFSLLICGLVVDVFNLLGQVIPNLIFFLANGAFTPTGGSSSLTGTGVVGGTAVVGGIGLVIMTGIASASGVIGIAFLIVFIVAIIALVSALVAMIYMVIRYFVLYALVIIAPLAFVAWVLPGTENFFKNWWKNFIRLNAMYVTIMGMLSLALLMSRILSSVSTNALQALIAALIPCIALLLVPRTLKWTTQGMSALAGGALTAMAGKAESTGKAAVSKGAARSKEAAKQARQDLSARFGANSPTTAALLAGKLPTTKGKLNAARQAEAYTQERNKNNRDSLKFAGSSLDFNGYNAELLRVASGQGSAKLGVGKATKAMQIAAISELAGRGQWEDLRKEVYGSVDETTFSQGLEPYIGDASTKAPDLVKPMGAAYGSISADKITELDKSSVATMVKYTTDPISAPPAGASPEDMAKYGVAVREQRDARDNLANAVRTIHGDKQLSAKLSADVRKEFNALRIPGVVF